MKRFTLLRLTMNLRAMEVLASPFCQLPTIRSLMSSESACILALHLTFLTYPALWVNQPDCRCSPNSLITTPQLGKVERKVLSKEHRFGQGARQDAIGGLVGQLKSGRVVAGGPIL
jgi:hypothetical protein